MGTERKILILDDNPGLRKTLYDILKVKEYAVLTAATGKAALSKIAREMPVVALIDLRLQNMDGLEVMKEIKKLSPDTECIVLTGYASQASAIEAVNLGAYSYLVKPYNMEQLLLSIHRVIEKREAEEALQESEAFNFALFQYNPIETIVVDLEGRVVKTNTAKKNSGDRVPNVGDVMYKDYAGKHKIDMYSELMKCMKPGKTKHFPELKYGDKFLNISMASFPQGAIITSQDITERRRAEEEREKLQAQLIQSEKMAGIGTLSSGIAHEFNNLLQIMSGYVQFAGKTKKSEDLKEAFDIVLSTTDRASKMIQDLLTFSRTEETKRELCSIKEPLESVLSLTEGQLKKNNIVVVREYGRASQLKVNKGEMQQVFLNMVTNARDTLLPRGGRLEIGIRQEKGQVKVTFHDTGKGIRKEDLGRVFEPFYTTKGAVGGSETIAGTGLGLSVSYGIVKRHGGVIEMESKVGKGSTFTIKLPIKGAGIEKKM